MTPFTFLIAGCGSAGRHVAQVAARDGRGQIAALVDPQPHQLDQQRELYPDAASGDDFAALLKATRPDVAVIAGPDHLHAEQTLLALAHGCHALVEKPLATTVADARRVVEAAAASNRRVMTDHTMRYMHPWAAMAQAALCAPMPAPPNKAGTEVAACQALPMSLRARAPMRMGE